MWARFFVAIDDIILKFKCPSTVEWIKDVVYLYNGILFNPEKEGGLTIFYKLGGTWGHYAK